MSAETIVRRAMANAGLPHAVHDAQLGACMVLFKEQVARGQSTATAEMAVTRAVQLVVSQEKKEKKPKVERGRGDDDEHAVQEDDDFDGSRDGSDDGEDSDDDDSICSGDAASRASTSRPATRRRFQTTTTHTMPGSPESDELSADSAKISGGTPSAGARSDTMRLAKSFG